MEKQTIFEDVRFLKLSNMEIFGTLLFGSFPRNYGGPW